MSNDTTRIYKHDRPSLVIECTGGANLGRCYNSMTYKVTSMKPLSGKDLGLLREAGFLGYGQEFFVYQTTASAELVRVPATLDWQTSPKVEPSGHDEVPCVLVNDRTGEVLANPSINPYTGTPDLPTKIPYYIYKCESRCDSGD